MDCYTAFCIPNVVLVVIVKIVTGSENRREVALLAVIIALKVKVCYLI